MTHHIDEFSKSLANESIPRRKSLRLLGAAVNRQCGLRAIALVALLLGTTAASAQPLAPPAQKGPFNVGVTTFSSTMTGGRIALIQVYYPTLAASQEGSKYTIATPVGTYDLRSPLGAVHDAQAAPGRFPLVVHDHGGPLTGADFNRVVQLPLHESMASHGFVTVVALHAPNAVARVRDLPLVIDAMLARSATNGDILANSIDPAKIGLTGNATGGAAAIGAAAGWTDNGIAADSRIKAMVLYEPGPDYSLDDARTLTIPYLIMGGTQFSSGLAVPTLFNATTDSMPRYYVLNPNATHRNYLTSVGAEIDQTREAALLADPSIPEPLTTLSPSNPAANRAYVLWNQGQILGLGFGGGRNICNRVGVNSIRSLDLDHDGFTDSPPFMATDEFTLEPPIPEEEMVPMIHLYTVSFWKAHLQGDNRYRHFLTPGYAQHNNLKAVVRIE